MSTWVLSILLSCTLFRAEGEISWYGVEFSGRQTANCEVFDPDALTAASPILPFGTVVRVCTDRRCTVVRINDRGPFKDNRILDISYFGALLLGMRKHGVRHARLTILHMPRNPQFGDCHRYKRNRRNKQLSIILEKPGKSSLTKQEG